jgi:N-acetylglucosaminyldiphosphoundecaprenol N-acetyl-beta-D-mannosaminyltransferase
VVATDYVWQTLENISGRQTLLLRLLAPPLRHLFGILEHVPLLRTLGVSQVLVARKPAVPVAVPDRSAVYVLGVRIDRITLPQLLAYIEQRIEQRQRAIIGNVNVHAMNLAYEQPWFRDFLNQSDLVFCDGFGVKWGARLLGQHIPQRFTPPDWLDQLAALGARRGYRFFLLGARPGVAWRAAQRLRATHPDLCIAGVHHGYFDKTPGSAENDAIISYINAVQPDILILGFGMPLQERWLRENWPHLNAHVALTGGAVFDYIAGEVRRGPRWMTDNGLEWLARLVIEPRRLWQRYLVGNPLFLWRVLRHRIAEV